MKVPSQHQTSEFNLRRELIEYTLCSDNDIWEEIRREEEAKAKEKETKKSRLKRLSLNSNDLASKYNPFFLDTFQNSWSYDQEQLDLAKQNLKPELISPSNLDWDQRRKEDAEANKPKSGQYTLNPETQNLNFERAKIFIPDPPSWRNKDLSDVGQDIETIYSKKFYAPGIEYWQYISQNPDKAPPQLKDSKNYYFYFGSLLRDRKGRWVVSCSDWGGSSFKRNAYWLGSDWHSLYRVVLLEK